MTAGVMFLLRLSMVLAEAARAQGFKGNLPLRFSIRMFYGANVPIDLEIPSDTGGQNNVSNYENIIKVMQTLEAYAKANAGRQTTWQYLGTNSADAVSAEIKAIKARRAQQERDGRKKNERDIVFVVTDGGDNTSSVRRSTVQQEGEKLNVPEIWMGLHDSENLFNLGMQYFLDSDDRPIWARGEDKVERYFYVGRAFPPTWLQLIVHCFKAMLDPSKTIPKGDLRKLIESGGLRGSSFIMDLGLGLSTQDVRAVKEKIMTSSESEYAAYTHAYKMLNDASAGRMLSREEFQELKARYQAVLDSLCAARGVQGIQAPQVYLMLGNDRAAEYVPARSAVIIDVRAPQVLVKLALIDELTHHLHNDLPVEEQEILAIMNQADALDSEAARDYIAYHSDEIAACDVCGLLELLLELTRVDDRAARRAMIVGWAHENRSVFHAIVDYETDLIAQAA